MYTGNAEFDAATFLNVVCEVPKSVQPFLLFTGSVRFSVDDAKSLAAQLLTGLATLPTAVVDETVEQNLANLRIVSEAITSVVPAPHLCLYASTSSVKAKASAKFKIFVPKLVGELQTVTEKYTDRSLLLVQALLKLNRKINFKMGEPVVPLSLQPALPVFDESNVGSWLDNVHTLYTKFKVKSAEVPFYIASILPVSAQPIHDEFKDKPWAEYRQALVEAFTAEVSFDAVRQKLLGMRQTPAESFRNFVYRVKQASRVAGPLMSEAELCRILLQILPREDAQLMCTQKCSTVKDFITTFEALKLQHNLIGFSPSKASDPAAAAGSAGVPQAAGAAAASPMFTLMEEFLQKKKAEKDQTAAIDKLKLMFAEICGDAPSKPQSGTAEDALTATFEKLMMSYQQNGSGQPNGPGHSGRGANRGGGGGRGRGRGGAGRYGQGYQPRGPWYGPLSQYRQVFDQHSSPRAQFSNMLPPPPPAPMGSAVPSQWHGAQYQGGQVPRRKCVLCNAFDHILSNCPYKQQVFAQRPHQ